MEDARYIKFENYLNNELSGDDLKLFEEKLKSDPDFKEEFEIYKALETSLSSKFNNEEGEQELRKSLTNLGNKFIKKEKKSKVISLKKLRPFMVAASIALLIGFFLFNNGMPAYSDFANHNNLELVVRSENNEAIKKAETAFNSKNYNEALQQLNTLSQIYLNDTEIALYKGICYLEMNNYFEAQAIFDNISNGNSALKTKATWYKALSLLKQQKYIECKKVLKTIPKSAEEYQQAKKLMKKL
jgi:tetratricopeptide (TPR) repeat protein